MYSSSILYLLYTNSLTYMLVKEVERTYSIYPNSMVVTVYSDTLDTDSNKHILTTYQYTIELYTSRGNIAHYTNSHSVDLYA